MLTYNEILMVIAMMIALGVITLCLTIFLRNINSKLEKIVRMMSKTNNHSDLPPSK